MPEPENQSLITLLWTCIGLSSLLLVLVFWLSARLGRLEKLLGGKAAQAEKPEETGDSESSVETSPGGAFETFLNEDPTRRELPKKEQFAAYREWRHQKGMNWSGGASS